MFFSAGHGCAVWQRLIACLAGWSSLALMGAAPADEPVADSTAAQPPSFVRTLSTIMSGDASPMGGVDAEPEPLPSGGVSTNDAGLFDIHVRDAEIGAVLEMLSYQARSNIVASGSVTGAISANLYNVSLAEALDAILAQNKLAWRQNGKTIFVGTPEEVARHGPPAQTRVFRLRYITRQHAASAVRPLLSVEGAVVEGSGEEPQTESKGGIRAAAGDELLIVTDRPERLEAIARLVEQIDVRPRQVLIEATVLRATLNEQNQWGIDFTLLGGVDFQNVSSTSDAVQNLATGALPAREFQDTNFNANTNFARNVSEGGFTFGVIKNNIAAFIRALEDVTDVVVVANPKVIALNRQPAEIIVGRRDGYLTTTVTETAAVQTVEFLETGTQVRLTPFVADDSSVRLEVHPKDSNGGLTSANLPFEETTEAHVNVMLNDGHTILIGGLFRERTISSRSQVPLLGDIPGAGLLFQSRDDQTVREEVIILLTVHVLKDTQEEQDAFASLLEDVERVRVGTRRGLLGTGRERLAQAYYQEAVRRLDKGDTDGALLHVRMALHNQPGHVPGLKLSETLICRRLWEDEGSRGRGFIQELIRQRKPEPERSQPPFGRPRIDLAPPARDESLDIELQEKP